MKIIRNFSIIAHIDHGKSTLSDRLLELSGSFDKRDMREQVLDSMSVEREHGITVKAHHVRLNFVWKGTNVQFNLIDTPGHVDFSYEVSRSLAACEGAVLLVDATQGVEAQTISHLNEALAHNLPIIPVLNKIDLPAADVELSGKEIVELTGCSENDILLISAKDGTGVDELIDKIIEKFPHPLENGEKPLRALIFDSTYDNYRGAIPFVRIFDGSVRKGDLIKFMSTQAVFDVTEVGFFTPKMKECDYLSAGDVGYIVCNIRNIEEIHVGDTMALKAYPVEPLKGYKEVKPMVFSGFYPSNGEDYEKLKDSLGKLKLNDAAFTFIQENSEALGYGFRCGFLGMLHMKIVQERLETEFDLDIIATIPNVVYKYFTVRKEEILVDNPAKMPDITRNETVYEPFLMVEIFTPPDYIGPIMQLVLDRRGKQVGVEYITEKRVFLKYEMPMADVIFDFFDKLKTITKGYASMDYQMLDYRQSELVRLDILVNGERVDALSSITAKEKAFFYGNKLTRKLKEVIHKQQFEISIQAAIGTKVIAKSVVKAVRKDVLAKCYGGDITRKRKLLEKQKEGKKRMKMLGRVEIPQEAFLAALSIDEQE
ncbi:MAG: translation elongation factor 4 [bacterium]|nr:translation elongation factor 4 [bacterium]